VTNGFAIAASGTDRLIYVLRRRVLPDDYRSQSLRVAAASRLGVETEVVTVAIRRSVSGDLAE